MPYVKNVWVDELLSGAERYNIKTDAGAAIESNVQIELNTSVAVAGTSVDADKMNNIEDGIEAIAGILTLTQYQLLARTTASSGDAEKITSSANVYSILQAANYAAVKSLLDLEIGVDVQAYSANLTTWAGKTSPSGDVIGSSDTQTLTNKRVTQRVGSTTSSATPTINTDNFDAYKLTAQAEAITSFTTNLSGTPTDFQKLTIRIKDNGTARAITWGASFEARGTALPTTTVISKVLTVGFIYDTVSAKWGCVASAQEA